MNKLALVSCLVMSLLLVSEEGFGQGLYKWVDEKGTLHFSESPPPEKKEEGAKNKENTSQIIKKLEVGNRTIPEDMKKYGPAGGAVAQGSQQSSGGSRGGTKASVPVRRT